MTARVLRIRTPEGVVFSQTLAGPVIRCMALIIDLACISAITTVCGIAITFVAVLSVGIAIAMYTVLYFIISIGYGMAFEWLWRGQTVGKKILRLRVVDAEGLKLQFHQIVMRNLLRFVDSLPFFYVIGGVSCWFSKRFQRLGDIAANTIVVRMPKIAEPDLEQVTAGRYNSLRAYPHLEARLRQHTSAAEASIALQAVLRRDDFDPAERVELFTELASFFREKTAFPAEATDGVTDEQYIRNVVDVLYRSRAGK
jgi:uncharacterized RDD family membrane protein YckC